MPSSSEHHGEERFAELAALLRDARPRPSDGLRERVRELALAPRPAPAPRRLRLGGRRLVAVSAAAALVAIAGAGLVATLARDGAGEERDAAVASSAPAGGAAKAPAAEDSQALELAPPATTRSGALPPASGRAQEYRAELSVRVDGVGELASTTSEAMRIARSLGGYVVSAAYDEPGDEDGDSRLVVRVPTARVQDAIARFSQLGTIVAQHISVVDLQTQLDRQADAIAVLERTIARLEDQLDDSTLTADARERLRLQLLEARRDLASRRGASGQTRRRAATARIALTLTTRDDAQEIVPVPANGGGLGDVLGDAVSLLAAGLVWTLAALIVASPLLLLAVLLVLGLRTRRRLEERRLLERPAG